MSNMYSAEATFSFRMFAATWQFNPRMLPFVLGYGASKVW